VWLGSWDTKGGEVHACLHSRQPRKSQTLRKLSSALWLILCELAVGPDPSCTTQLHPSGVLRGRACCTASQPKYGLLFEVLSDRKAACAQRLDTLRHCMQAEHTMVDATAGRPDSPAQYGKPPPAGGVPSGLPRPLSSSSSLGLGFEDGQSHSNGGNSGFGSHRTCVLSLTSEYTVPGPVQLSAMAIADMWSRQAGHALHPFTPCSAPAPNASLGAVGSENPRSLITWDSFNSTDFNALKSAVGLANVSAAFAWQSPPALAPHSMGPGGDSAFAPAAPFPPGASAASTSGPAAVSMNGFPGGRGSADATGATAGMHSSGSGSPYGGSLAAGLAAGMPPLLGDALPPLAAPPGLANSFQQVRAALLSRMCC
jgi:hypothetical protein